MAKATRSDNWGFPRWSSYGAKSTAATRIRLCDREGCSSAGDRPAPKAPNMPDRWYFCEPHAAEYNKGWNYFAGLSAEEAARQQAEAEGGPEYRRSAHYQWAGSGDGSRSQDEMRALDVLELDPDADAVAVKAAFRRMAKENHPDVNGGDKDAAARFQQIQASYDVLRKADERRNAVANATI